MRTSVELFDAGVMAVQAALRADADVEAALGGVNNRVRQSRDAVKRTGPALEWNAIAITLEETEVVLLLQFDSVAETMAEAIAIRRAMFKRLVREHPYDLGALRVTVLYAGGRRDPDPAVGLAVLSDDLEIRVVRSFTFAT